MEGEHRPQEPAGVLLVVLETGVDVIGHLVQRVALGRVAQAEALRLDVIGFRLDHKGTKINQRRLDQRRPKNQSTSHSCGQHTKP